MSREEILEKIKRAAAEGATALDLSGAGLAEVPSEVWGLTGLKSLSLAGNELKRLAPEVGRLKALADLDLSDNKLSSLPASVCALAKLTLLDVSDNQLASLPEEFGRLKELVALWLGGNRFEEVPPPLAKLARLRLLGLERNRLRALPEGLRRLRRLAVLKLEGNALGLPPEVLRREGEPELIVSYYFAQRDAARRPLNEAKLLFVGHASAGKTSLVNALLGREFNPREEATAGVGIMRWQVAASAGGAPVRLKVWDFGGQELMHATHQFFLTRRSLYVLVVDARVGAEDNRVEHWLKIIQSFGKDSPVVVVGNKIDQQTFDVDRRRLQNKYANIRAFVETSCQTGRGVEELKETIAREVASLAHVSDELPAAWLAVKERIEGAFASRVPHADFVRLCREEGVADEPSQAALLALLHDLGVVLSFRDADIFNPEWVTNGLHRVLNSAALAESHGLLDASALARVLDARDYPPETHPPLLDMMRRFELGFGRVGPRGAAMLVPSLLGRDVPEACDLPGALSFRYRYNVLPASIVSRFIVRTHRMICEGKVWRTGVVLRGEEGNRALVEADIEDRTVVLLVDGPEASARRFLDLLRSHFEAIHSTLPGINAAEDAPPLTRPEAAVDYKRLLLDIKHVTERVPERLESVVNLRWFLDNIERERARRKSPRATLAATTTATTSNAASTAPSSTSLSSTPTAAEVAPTEEEEATPERVALARLARIRASLDASSKRFARRCLYAYLSALALVGLMLAALTYALGWDTMEPWTYFIGGGATLGAYAYFAFTQQEFSPAAIYQQLAERKRLQAYRDADFDPDEFERLTQGMRDEG